MKVTGRVYIEVEPFIFVESDEPIENPCKQLMAIEKNDLITKAKDLASKQFAGIKNDTNKTISVNYVHDNIKVNESQLDFIVWEHAEEVVCGNEIT